MNNDFTYKFLCKNAYKYDRIAQPQVSFIVCASGMWGDKYIYYKAENNQISIAEQSADHSWSLSSKLIAVEVQTEVVGGHEE